MLVGGGTELATTNWCFFVRAITYHVDISGRTIFGGRTGSKVAGASSGPDATSDIVFSVGLTDLPHRLLAADVPAEPGRLLWG